jgi:uncharacterized membrane protein YbaN (DUF454 family)
MMNVGVGVGGVALPQLCSVVFSYHASRFLPRVVCSIAKRLYQTDTFSNLQHTNAMARAALMIVGGVAPPQLCSVVFSYHASRFLPRVVCSIAKRLYQTDTFSNLQHTNAMARAALMIVGGVAPPQLCSVAFLTTRRCFYR